MSNKIFSVSEINNHIKRLLDADSLLPEVYIKGELSNYKVYPSGHHYFTMKDQDSALRCVMFKSSASQLKFRPENGMKIVAFGRVAVFPRDGVYQLYASELTPDGVGDLFVAFEQLKEKLYKEGLFDAKWKKSIPLFPQKIAVITSSAGAAVRDIIRVLGHRYPLAKVVILPVRVQGELAPAEIVGAISYANRYNVADVIITGRGGGSIEDLWAFNDERVARAIFASDIPVISAVGHEPDITIADFVADLRAATPSNAAELAVMDTSELKEALRSYETRSYLALKREISALRQRINDFSQKRVLLSPTNYIEDKRILLDHMQSKLGSAAAAKIASSKTHYAAFAAKLDALSPLKVLGRGYAIAKKLDGRVIKSARDVEAGERVSLRLREDTLLCTVEQAADK